DTTFAASRLHTRHCRPRRTSPDTLTATRTPASLLTFPRQTQRQQTAKGLLLLHALAAACLDQRRSYQGLGVGPSPSVVGASSPFQTLTIRYTHTPPLKRLKPLLPITPHLSGCPQETFPTSKADTAHGLKTLLPQITPTYTTPEPRGAGKDSPSAAPTLSNIYP
ncbi:unnamed protein product, partial [Bubo scandiacus]